MNSKRGRSSPRVQTSASRGTSLRLSVEARRAGLPGAGNDLSMQIFPFLCLFTLSCSSHSFVSPTLSDAYSSFSRLIQHLLVVRALGCTAAVFMNQSLTLGLLDSAPYPTNPEKSVGSIGSSIIPKDGDEAVALEPEATLSSILRVIMSELHLRLKFVHR